MTVGELPAFPEARGGSPDRGGPPAVLATAVGIALLAAAAGAATAAAAGAAGRGASGGGAGSDDAADAARG